MAVVGCGVGVVGYGSGLASCGARLGGWAQGGVRVMAVACENWMRRSCGVQGGDRALGVGGVSLPLPCHTTGIRCDQGLVGIPHPAGLKKSRAHRLQSLGRRGRMSTPHACRPHTCTPDTCAPKPDHVQIRLQDVEFELVHVAHGVDSTSVNGAGVDGTAVNGAHLQCAGLPSPRASLHTCACPPCALGRSLCTLSRLHTVIHLHIVRHKALASARHLTLSRLHTVHTPHLHPGHPPSRHAPQKHWLTPHTSHLHAFALSTPLTRIQVVHLHIVRHKALAHACRLDQRRGLFICVWCMAQVQSRPPGCGEVWTSGVRQVVGYFHWADPGDLRRSTQTPRSPMSIGVNRTPVTVGEVLNPPRTAFKMVPGVLWRFAGKSPAPSWPSAAQLLLHRLPHHQFAKQPSSGKRGRNGNVLENQPRKDENAEEVCDFRGLRTHFGPAASAQWKLPPHSDVGSCGHGEEGFRV
eukprot:364063-Chlamydomonas_euryale.AAC.4